MCFVFIFGLCSVCRSDILGNCAGPVGAWGSVVVKALRCQSEGLGIDPQWCRWGFFPKLPTVRGKLLGVKTAGA